MKSAAFFDIDSTIIKGSCQREFLKYLIKNKVISPLRIGLTFIEFLLRNVRHISWYMFKHYFLYLRGQDVILMKRMAKEAFRQRIRKLIYSRAVKLIKMYKSEGYKIVLVSGTLMILARQLKDYLKADYVIATDIFEEKNRFTGKIKGLHPFGINKALLIKKLAKEKGIELNTSKAFGDHYTDRFMLEAVSKAIVVQPGWLMGRYAKKRNWSQINF